MAELRLLKGGACPGCGRRDIKPSNRHKKRPGGDWCHGQAEEKQQDHKRAMRALRRVQDHVLALIWDGREKEALAFLSPITSRLGPDAELLGELARRQRT